MEHIHALSRKVYSEPTGAELKPYILEYIRYYIDQANNASNEELLYGKIGAEASSNICGALAWQGATGVEGEDWITEESEPLLWKISSVACTLDADTNNLPAWRELLSLAKQI